MSVIIDLNPANLREAEDLLDQLEPQIETDLLAIYRLGGEMIVAKASEDAPKKTGFMASLIGFVVVYRGITIVAGAPYTMFQEYGTEKIIAKLFITNSIAEIMPEIDEACEQLVSEYLQAQADRINSIDFEVLDFMGFLP